MNRGARLRIAAVLCLVIAVAIGIWLFSGEAHVPDAGTGGSWLADLTVVGLVVATVTLWRRAGRAHRT